MWILSLKCVINYYAIPENYRFCEIHDQIAVLCLTVGPWADVKNGFTWKIIIVFKVRGGHGE